jgi:hypothetical protein
VKQQVCGVPNCATLLDKGAVFRGLRLCVSCRNLLATRLASLPQMYQACEQALEVRHQHSVRVVRGRRPTGICLDDETVTVRSDTIGVLSAWCEMIVDERGAPGPGGLDVPTLASFLQAHLDWLSTHVVAADFAEEIAALVMAVRKVLAPAQERTIDLAPCPKDGCGRMVRANISTVQRRPSLQVRCDAGHTWQPWQWLDLRRQLDLTNCDVFA